MIDKIKNNKAVVIVIAVNVVLYLLAVAVAGGSHGG